MPASVNTPSTSVANNRIRRRAPCNDKRGTEGFFWRRRVLGMRTLSAGAMLTSHCVKLKETRPCRGIQRLTGQTEWITDVGRIDQ